MESDDRLTIVFAVDPFDGVGMSNTELDMAFKLGIDFIRSPESVIPGWQKKYFSIIFHTDLISVKRRDAIVSAVCGQSCDNWEKAISLLLVEKFHFFKRKGSPGNLGVKWSSKHNHTVFVKDIVRSRRIAKRQGEMFQGFCMFCCLRIKIRFESACARSISIRKMP
jgi:hypothetical protein